MSHTLCIYLHGFNSTPQTNKAALLKLRLIADKADVTFIVPALPVTAPLTITLIEDIMKNNPHDTCVLLGSSLGGLYATYLAEKYGLKAVLINPVFDQLFDDPTSMIGQHVNRYTGDTFEVTKAHFDELNVLLVPKLTYPEKLLILLQTGDEVLDYRRVVARYPTARQIIQEGGSHRFEHFDAMLDGIVDFLDLSSKG